MMRSGESFQQRAAREEQNALLRAHGYCWRKREYVRRGRTYRRWELLAPNGQETTLEQALRAIEKGPNNGDK